MKGILLDPDTGDIVVHNRSVVIDDNTEQVAQCVLMAARGSFKEHPLIGGEIHRLINGSYDPMWSSEVRPMLQACGVPVKRIAIKENQITIK